jgi:hypothetical protein
VAVLAGAEYSEDTNVTGCLVAAGVGDDFVKYSITAGAGAFAYTRMLGRRPAAGIFPETLEVRSNPRQQPSRRSS